MWDTVQIAVASTALGDSACKQPKGSKGAWSPGGFGRPLQVTVRHMLRDRCPVCNVGVLWPNGWIDQDATWYGGGP